MKTGAFIFIQTEIGSEMKVFEELYKIPEVKEVYIVYGIYDIIAKIEADSLEKIRQIIISRIRQIPEIRTTNTMVVVEGSRKQV